MLAQALNLQPTETRVAMVSTVEICRVCGGDMDRVSNNAVLDTLPPSLGMICFDCSRLVGGRQSMLHMFLRTRVIAPDVNRGLWLKSFALVFNELRDIRAAAHSERAARAAHNFNLRFIPMCIKLGLQMGRGLAKAEQSF